MARHVVLVDLVTAAALASAAVAPDISKGTTSAWWLIPGVACFAALGWRRRQKQRKFKTPGNCSR